MLTARAAALISSSDHIGTRCERWSRDGPPGPFSPLISTFDTSIAIRAVRIAIATNAQRQSPNWAKSPPVTGPINVATAHIADTSADPRVHSHWGSAELI